MVVVQLKSGGHMNWFNDLSVARKLLLTFSLVVFLVVILGGFALKALSDLDGAARELSDNWLPSVDKARSIQYQIARNAEQASVGTETVQQNIDGVNQSARTGGAAAEEMLSAATNLSREAQQMQGLVQGFLRKVRAA